ncbi:MAG: hypothetical protein EXS51_02770 [Candidatus Taylorbacteria bacterium]|nr:hypothetical protein [Candidatus Taylorbacteria bacterium]
MSNTKENPEAATGNEAGDKKLNVPADSLTYACNERAAGRLFSWLQENKGKTLAREGGEGFRWKLAPDGLSFRQEGGVGEVIDLPEVVVELPTPPWSAWEVSYESRYCPGWYVFKSEAMEIVLGWVNSIFPIPAVATGNPVATTVGELVAILLQFGPSSPVSGRNNEGYPAPAQAWKEGGTVWV